jgi:hypothetical protein
MSTSYVVTTNAGKEFEKPQSGTYHGVLADIVDLGQVTTSFQGVTKVQEMFRFIWVLNVNGKDGQPLSVTQRFGKNLHEKSNLYKSVKQIIGGAPPATIDLSKLIGVTRQLFILTETNPQGTFANVQGIAPAAAGVTVQVPQGFVRDQNKPVAEQARNKQKRAPQGQAAPQPQQANNPYQTQPTPAPAPAASGYEPDIAF